MTHLLVAWFWLTFTIVGGVVAVRTGLRWWDEQHPRVTAFRPEGPHARALDALRGNYERRGR